MDLPRLLVFAPCERVVIGEDGSSSLIALLQGLAIEAAELPEGELPDGTFGMIPLRWHAFSLWENPYSHDEYTQRFEIISPRKRVVAQIEVRLEFAADKRFFRANTILQGFPIDGDGDYTARLLVRSGQEEFVERATFPIPFSFKKVS